MPNFTEPTSKKKSDSCVKTIGDSNIGEISLSISAQWDSGFCGRWITKCPSNRLISFNVPSEISDVRGWNMINMQKINKVKLRKNENMYCEETQIVTTHENFITDQMIKKK